MDQCANKLAAASHRICTHGAAALLADDSIDRPPERTHRTAGRVTSICFLISCSLQARSTAQLLLDQQQRLHLFSSIGL
jgi:hypothetical protein